MLKTETKTEKAMLGYIDRNQNVVAIETVVELLP